MIKLLSLFSGIGAFEKALENLGEPFETVAYCEIDKYASKAYSLIHGISEDKNLWDVTKINTSDLPKDIDLITYGFPCQDISLSGKQKGFTDEGGKRTRSGLFFEAMRIIQEIKPRFAIAENVKNLTSEKFENEFNTVFRSLEEAGYTSYWAVLNAKDFGIPQNRERVIIISIRNDINHGFIFPARKQLNLRLKDLLEQNVDEKYYLSEQLFDYVLSTETEDLLSCLPIKEATQKGYAKAYEGDYVNLQFPNSETRRGRVGEQMANTLLCNDSNGVVVKDGCIKVGNLNRKKFHEFSNRVYSPEGLARTLMGEGGNQSDKTGQYIMPDLRIRKLTPKECFRLMGFDDKDVDICKENGISNSQLYKMAGNSIVVNVLMAIFEQLINQYRYNKYEDCESGQMTFDEILYSEVNNEAVS